MLQRILADDFSGAAFARDLDVSGMTFASDVIFSGCSVDGALRLDDARLLDFKAMAELFPDGAIERERFAGFTKSLIAIR